MHMDNDIQDYSGNPIILTAEYTLRRKIGIGGWSSIEEDAPSIVPDWGNANVYKGSEILDMIRKTNHAPERWLNIWSIVPLGFAPVVADMAAEEAILNLFEHPRLFQEAQDLISNVYGDHPFMNITKRFNLRQKVIDRYGFAVPCLEAIERLQNLSPIVEVGAGSGYWSRLVNKRAGEPVMIATDSFAYLTDGSQFGKYWEPDNRIPIKHLSANVAVEEYKERNVFVSWPSYDESWAEGMARLIQPSKLLIYIGESEGGCTADDSFFKLMDSDFRRIEDISIPRWESIYDRMYIFERKA